jgi:REP element-mobilizing transposase RayT
MYLQGMNIRIYYLKVCDIAKRKKVWRYTPGVPDSYRESNHVHLIFSSIKKEKPELILGSFKRFTSKAIVAAIKENPQESRKEWLLKQFEEAGKKTSNVKQYQLWRHDNKPIELWSNKVIDEKLNYIHNNPVEEGLVFKAEQYVCSSAIDYAGEKGLLDIVLI